MPGLPRASGGRVSFCVSMSRNSLESSIFWQCIACWENLTSQRRAAAAALVLSGCHRFRLLGSLHLGMSHNFRFLVQTPALFSMQMLWVHRTGTPGLPGVLAGRD